MLHYDNLQTILPIINSMGAPVFLVDVLADGGFSFAACNHLQEDIFQLTTEQIKGKRPEELFNLDYARQLTQGYTYCVKMNRAVEFSAEGAKGNCQTTSHLIPIRDEEGQLVRILGTTGETSDQQITGRNPADIHQKLNYYSHFQSLITTLATEFINLPPQKIDNAIIHVLQAIGEFVGANRCSINLLTEDALGFRRTHEWVASGLGAFNPLVHCTPLQNYHVKCEFDKLLSQGVVAIPNMTQLSPEFNNLKVFLNKQQAKSLIGVTLILRQKQIGLITIQFTRPQAEHSNESLKLLEVLGEIFVNALDRKQRDEELQRFNNELEKRVIQRTAALAESEQKFRLISEQAMVGILIMRNGKLLYVNQTVQKMTQYPVSEILTWEPYKYFELIHDEDRDKVLVRMQGASENHIYDDEFRLCDRDGNILWVEEHSRPISYQGYSAILTVIVDVTKRKSSETTQRQHRTFIEALLDTGLTLNSTLNFEELIDHIFANMQRVVQYDTATILLNNHAQYLEIIAKRGYPIENSSATRLYREEAKNLFHLLESGIPQIISDIHLIPDLQAHPIHAKTNISYLFIPMILDGAMVGILALGSQVANFFQPIDADYLQIFAQQTGLALRNVQLYQEARAVATLQERQRLARDLHDSVSQTLFSAVTFAELVAHLVDKNPEKARQYIGDVEQLTRTALTEMRTLLVELRPGALEQTELGILLKQLCDALVGNTAIKVTLVVTEKTVLPEDIQIVFYRIAQEALHNIAKHAHATAVQVRLQKTGNLLELRIRDNGCGFVNEGIEACHFGLKIMAERANSIGGNLSIQSANGTEIILTKSLEGESIQ